MASEIYNEISTTTGYTWDPEQDTGPNIIQLAKSTDSMTDAAFAKLSKPADDFLATVAVAIEKGTTIPEFPDYVENVEPAASEPAPDPAPRRRRRAPGTPAAGPATPTEAAPIEAAPTEAAPAEADKKPARKKRSTRKKASTAPAVEPTAQVAVEASTGEPEASLKWGDKTSGLRELAIDNPELSHRELFDLAVAAGLEPNEATVRLIGHSTRHTLSHLARMGYYDHTEATRERAAAESAAEATA